LAEVTTTAPATLSSHRAGMLYSFAAYASWGLFPLYFKAVHVRPLEFLGHRIVWSVLLLYALLAVKQRWTWLGEARRSRALLLGFAASSACLSINWFIYIYAVTTDRVVDASLGYFINPLVSVLLGVVVLKERLRRLQWVAVALATAGVLWLTLLVGELPWIGLSLAFSFGTYGLLRKTAKLGALEGLTLETTLLAPLAALYLGWLVVQGQSGFIAGSAADRVLLLMSGPLTAGPLLLFAAGARRIPLSLMGLLQYVAPTGQLLLGVLVWHEPFGHERVLGFALIWFGLAVYSAESLWTSRALRWAKRSH
jgi:chloramphenicol-sensitive protein RarD